jgi:hypothetical protein
MRDNLGVRFASIVRISLSVHSLIEASDECRLAASRASGNPLPNKCERACSDTETVTAQDVSPQFDMNAGWGFRCYLSHNVPNPET